MMKKRVGVCLGQEILTHSSDGTGVGRVVFLTPEREKKPFLALELHRRENLRAIHPLTRRPFQSIVSLDTNNIQI